VKRLVALALAAAVGSSRWASAEDPAPRHAGSGSPATAYTAEDIRATVEEHVERATRESGGVYRLPDAHAGKTLELELVRISIVAAGSLWRVHDPDRGPVEGRTHFACTAFHLVGAPEGKLYDIDMQIERREGGLAVTDVRIHKEKQLVNGEWVWVVRPQGQGAGSAKGR
jgi:hypothetical protein